MATLNDYFRTEARDFLNALERSLKRAPAPDAAELHRAVRGLRGTAQMAREQRVFDVVSAFESVTRAISAGALAWSDNIAARARDTIEDLRVLLDTTEDDEQLDARVNGAAARWREADPDAAPPAAAPVIDPDTREFREFAAKEAAEIADALDHGIADLQTDPMNREPLTTILRRQRALLGAARLEEIPVIADILRAVEDLTRVIVKLDVGVKQEWLDIYRVARDALQTTIAPLLRDELPQSSNSVSRLRHMRAELLERYGSAVAEPPTAEDPFARTAPPADTPAPPRPAAAAPTAPFMAPARSTTPAQPSTSQPSTSHPSTMQPSASQPSAWQPAASRTQPPLSHTPAPSVPPSAPDSAPLDTSPSESSPPESSSAPTPWEAAAAAPQDFTGSDSTPDVLELDEQSAVDEQSVVDEQSAVDARGAVDEQSVGYERSVADEQRALHERRDADDREPEFLDLAEDTIVDEDGDMLDLGEDSIVDDDRMLDLSEESAVAGPGANHPDDEAAGVLDLGEDSVVSADVVTAGAVSTDDVLARARELRDIIARVASHDPVARAAVDELYDLIRTALG